MEEQSPDVCPAVRRLVEAGKIDEKTARRCRGLSGEFFAAFEPAFARLSFSNRRIFLTRLAEAFAGKTAREAEALKTRLLAARRPDEELRAVLMPELTELERRFAEISARFLRGSGVSLKAPPYFEGGGFTVSFTFNSAKALAARVRALERLAAEGGELFELL